MKENYLSILTLNLFDWLNKLYRFNKNAEHRGNEKTKKKNERF